MTDNNSKTVEKNGTVKRVATIGGIGVGTGLMATASNAALDVTSLTTEIASNGDSMQTVMLAVLTLVALFVGYRMIKRSMS